MRIDDLRPSSNMDDRRGRGIGGIAGLGGIGIIAIIVALLLGVDPGQLLGLLSENVPQEQSQPQGPRADDASFAFARRVMGSTEDVWGPLLKARGIDYQPAIFTAYDSATETGCGYGSSAVGPFYCPEDNHVYMDLSFFNELKDRFGAPGEFAQAYVIAHEVGHHVQNQLGISAKVQGEMEQADNVQRNRLSVRLELQADCFAGVWANRADKQFHMLQSGDLESGLQAASAVGDDRLQQQTQGQVIPDSFTHGTSAERASWFKRGIDTGDIDSCDTFGRANL